MKMDNSEAIKRVTYFSVHIDLVSRNVLLKIVHIDLIKSETYLKIFYFSVQNMIATVYRYFN